MVFMIDTDVFVKLPLKTDIVFGVGKRIWYSGLIEALLGFIPFLPESGFWQLFVIPTKAERWHLKCVLGVKIKANTWWCLLKIHPLSGLHRACRKKIKTYHDKRKWWSKSRTVPHVWFRVRPNGSHVAILISYAWAVLSWLWYHECPSSPFCLPMETGREKKSQNTAVLVRMSSSFINAKSFDHAISTHCLLTEPLVHWGYAGRRA